MKLEFLESQHEYRADGKRLPSVTEILRSVGIYSNYEFAAGYHRFRGAAVHAYCAILDLGGTAEIAYPPEYREIAEDIVNGYGPAYMRWKERTKFQGYCWECPMISHEFGYAGTFDVCGRFGDFPEVVLVDLKSGVLPDMVPVQLASYMELVRKGLPVDPQHPGFEWVQESIKMGVPVRRVAVRLEKTGKETMFTENSKRVSYNNGMWESAWRSALNIYTLRAAYGLLEARS